MTWGMGPESRSLNFAVISDWRSRKPKREIWLSESMRINGLIIPTHRLNSNYEKWRAGDKTIIKRWTTSIDLNSSDPQTRTDNWDVWCLWDTLHFSCACFSAERSASTVFVFFKHRAGYPPWPREPLNFPRILSLNSTTSNQRCCLKTLSEFSSMKFVAVQGLIILAIGISCLRYLPLSKCHKYCYQARNPLRTFLGLGGVLPS